jgi:tetrahydromethanopterin S-methyltransferase subunit E
MWLIVAAGITLILVIETRIDKRDANFSSVDTLILMLSEWGLISYLMSVIISKNGLQSDRCLDGIARNTYGRYGDAANVKYA